MHSQHPNRGVDDGFQNLDPRPQPPQPHHTVEPDDGIDIRKYLTALRRRWPLIAVCVVIAAAYALTRYSLTTKEYMASATIQIERKRLSLLALGQAGWLEDWWNMEYYPTQYRLLRSRGMAERVVQNLRLYDNPVFNQRLASRPADGDATLTDLSNAELAGFASRVMAGLEVRPIKDTQLVELIYRSTTPELAAQIANGYAEAFIEWGIETRSPTVGRASSFLSAQIETLRQEIEDRQQKLNALTGSGDFPIDPDGEALLETRQTLETRYNTVLGERIRLEASYRELLKLPPETAANASTGGRVSELKSDLFLLESEYRTKLDTYRPEWPEMTKLKQEIDDKRQQLDLLIQEQYRETKERAFAELQKARREEESLESELRKIADDTRLQNSAALSYSNMKQYIETRRDLLTDLVKRQSETEVAGRIQTSQESNVRIVDQAVVPGAPFRPSLENDLSRAIFLGFVLGIGAIFLIEFMDRTIKTPEELESILGLPTLALIPDLDQGRRGRGYGYGYGNKSPGYAYGYAYGYGSQRPKKGRRGELKDGETAAEAAIDDDTPRIELLPHHSPRLAVSEAYRSLRTALLLSSSKEPEVVALTSAEPSEGKTATTVNLGVVMAQLGRRVVIVDADLRRPRMHKIFKVSNRLGLVNYLTGHADVDQLFQQTEVPGLFVCPSGPIPPNPSELLASRRMRELVEAMRARFDFVLLDTPPVLPVTDTMILGPVTDGFIVCARAGSLVREDAKECAARLRYSELKVFGAVFNRHRTSSSRYQRRYQYYGVYEEREGEESETHAA